MKIKKIIINIFSKLLKISNIVLKKTPLMWYKVFKVIQTIVRIVDKIDVLSKKIDKLINELDK